MNFQYVYLAGPIDGLAEHQVTDWRYHAIDYLATHENASARIKTINPYRLETVFGEYTQEFRKKIARKNRMDCTKSDLILAYLPKHLNDAKGVSLGTVCEISWFGWQNKPVIVVTDDERVRLHPLIEDQTDVLDRKSVV